MSKQKSAPPIFPVNLGRDGWPTAYDTPVKRLLFLCGLRLAKPPGDSYYIDRQAEGMD
jgi:hypothetical protein